ncbi:type VI secretion system-associated FHA domain protein [Steroidobacter denitrificans]|nr:FHA domain-containing protein [Steroidobacter denitrificans]
MILTLEILGEQAEALGASSRKVFRSAGGTIGRLPDNDWVFPDPYVSGRHALIRYLNGKYYIEDTSTNGVAINSPENRLSRTEPQPLRHGDVLYIDAYEIGVSIEPAAILEKDLFTRLWHDTTGAPVPASASPVEEAAEVELDELDLSPEDPWMNPKAVAAGSGREDTPDAKPPADDAWMVSASNAAGIEVPDSLQDPAQVLHAVRLAFDSMLAQFDPDRLQEDFDRQISQDSMLGAPAKMRYWDLYRDRYAIIAKDADRVFRSLFAETFSSAYGENPQRRKTEASTREK